MIPVTGVIPANAYKQESERLDAVEPAGMARVAAAVFALDASRRPFRVKMDHYAAEVADDAQVGEFLARFEHTAQGEQPAPLPLQNYCGEPLVRRTVRSLLEAGVGSVAVIVRAGMEGEIADALDGLDARVVLADEGAIAAVDSASGLSSVEGFSRGEVLWAWSLFEGEGGGAGDRDADRAASADRATGCENPAAFDSMMLVYADEAAFEPRHYRKVRAKFEASPGADIAVAYTEWRPVAPALLSAGFLRRYAAGVVADPDADTPAPALDSGSAALTPSAVPKIESCEGEAARAVLRFDVRQAIMGEERLCELAPMPQGVLGADRGGLPASALATVRAARRGHGELEARLAKLAGRTSESPEAQAEARARELLGRLDASIGRDPIKGLDVADAWAARNRADFPFFAAAGNENAVYLDSAATSLTPASVIAAGVDIASRYNANVWRGLYPAAAASTMRFQAAREKVAAFIGADPRDVAFTSNTSDSLNWIARGWVARNMRSGERILVACNEHHSNLVPWQQIALERGLEVDYIPLDASGRIDMGRYREMLAEGAGKGEGEGVGESDPACREGEGKGSLRDASRGRLDGAAACPRGRVRLVCVAHVSNVLGLANPVEEMAALAHEHGALLVMDAAQSSPHVRIDVGELGCDFLAMSGHKLHGPTGIGVLWGRRERFAEMIPAEVGGGVISEVSYQGTYFRQAPYCFELGTPPFEQAVGLGAAVDYLAALGMDKVEGHARAMTRYALRAASLLPGVGVLGSHAGEDGCLGLFSYSVVCASSSVAARLLGGMGVSVRAGAHCALPFVNSLGTAGLVRVSMGPYTTKADVEAWAFGMSEILRVCEGERARS